MARLLTAGTDAIYGLHDHWLRDVLGSGDSLLTPGQSIWSEENLAELERCFIGNPDLTKDKRFLEKLHDQLTPASPAAVQLMAELHVVHFLIIWNGAISAATKCRDIETILSWMPSPPGLPSDVAAAMSPGLVHPGQYVMARRDIQLSWLILFSQAWHRCGAGERERNLADPWALRSFVETITGFNAAGAQLSLLHLAAPDTFEAIVSTNHRQLIADRFAPDATGGDIDRRLLDARARLSAELRDDFTWYDDPLIRRWSKGREWNVFLRWLERFRAAPQFDADERDYKLDVATALAAARAALFVGDESWTDLLARAFRHKSNNLTQWRRDQRFLQWMAEQPAEVEAALRTLWSTGDQVERLAGFLSLVPSSQMNAVGHRLNVASFLLLAAEPTDVVPVKVSTIRAAWSLAGWEKEPNGATVSEVYERVLAFADELVRDSAGWQIPLRDRLDAQGAVWALVNARDVPSGWSPTLWDEFTAWRTAEANTASDPEDDDVIASGEDEQSGSTTVDVLIKDYIAAAAEHLCVGREVLDEITELLDDKRQVVLYGPPGTGKTYLALRLARALVEEDDARVALVQFHPATSYEDFFEGLRPKVTDAGQVLYERTPGPLVTMADAAARDPQRRYILVIDEINRANLPKVFGELLFLLEYRHESARTLYRSNDPFRLPPNLWFIATMNTADRSVALIDAAMRRRFHFVPFFPHEGPMEGLLERWLRKNGGRRGVASLLSAVNLELRGLLGEHLLVGPSHFMKMDLSDRSIERIWTYNIFPLIEEHLWGNQAEIDRWDWASVHARYGHLL